MAIFSPDQFRAIRNHLRLSRRQLSGMSGHAVNTIYRTEFEDRVPSLDVLADFALAMGASVADFFTDPTDADLAAWDDVFPVRETYPDDRVFALAETWTMLAAERRARTRADARGSGGAA